MNKNSEFLQLFKHVLVLCAHTDDEQGCAGLIQRMIEQGSHVRYIALSRCEESVPPGYPIDVLETECKTATLSLGIPSNNVEIWRYRVRYFPEYRQNILEDFVRINREFKPDLVLVPSSTDVHQDHATVHQEGFRAFKYASILGYELPQNLNSFNNTAFVKLSESHLEQKILAMMKYESQKSRNYITRDFFRGLATVRGAQCNAQYAESFEVIRLIIG